MTTFLTIQVWLGVPFSESIDIFSLGLILAEIALSAPIATDNGNSQDVGSRISPLLAIAAPNRESFIYALCQLIEPMPNSLSGGKFWKDEYMVADAAKEMYGDVTSIAERLERVGHSPDLIAFLMCLLALDPTKRITAQEALYHSWILNPIVDPFGIYQPLKYSDDLTFKSSPRIAISPIPSIDTKHEPHTPDRKPRSSITNPTPNDLHIEDFKYRRKRSHGDSAERKIRYKMQTAEDVDDDDVVLI